MSKELELIAELERAVNQANAHRFDFVQPEESLGHRKVGGPDDFYNGARYVTNAFRRALRNVRSAAAAAEERGPVSDRASWRDGFPGWMRGTTPLMTEEEVAEFNQRTVERMNADDDFAHRIFTKPPAAEKDTDD